MLGKLQSKAKLNIYSIVLFARPQRTAPESRVEHVKHRREGDGQEMYLLNSGMCRQEIVDNV